MRGVALIAVLAALAACQDDTTSSGQPTPTPKQNAAIEAVIPTGDGPIMLAPSSTSLWVELHREDTVSRIDPETNEETERYNDRLYAHCQIISGADDDIWLSIYKRSYVTRINGTTGDQLDRVVVQEACSLARDGKSVWVVSPSSGTLSRVVPGKDQEVEAFHVARHIGSSVVTDDALWFTTEADGRGVIRLDRRTHEVTDAASEYPLADNVLAAFGSLWVSSRESSMLWKVDPKDGSMLDSVEVRRPNGLLEYDGRLWVTSLDGNLMAFDPDTLEQVASTNLGYVWLGPPVFAFGSLWTAALEDNVVLRVDPAKVG